MITKYHYVITTNFDYLIEIALKEVLEKQQFLHDKMLSIITDH